MTAQKRIKNGAESITIVDRQYAVFLGVGNKSNRFVVWNETTKSIVSQFATKKEAIADLNKRN